MKSAIVIGGGMSGCTISYLLSQNKWKVTLIEKEGYLGGGCRTFFYGGHPYTIGPRHLFTPYREPYEFINKFIPFRPLKHYLLSYVEQDKKFYSYPIHMDDVKTMPDYTKIKKELKTGPVPSKTKNFEEFWTYSVGKTLYDKFINNHTKKFWQIKSNTIITDFKATPKGATLQTGTRQCVPDYIIAYPIYSDGYNKYFDLCTENVDVKLNRPATEFDLEKKAVKTKNEWISADIIVSTIPPDILMNYCFGELVYIGRDFLKLVLPIEYAFPEHIHFVHYPGEEKFIRVVEYKKLTGHKSPYTLIGIEIPSFNNKMYPSQIRKEQDKAKKYLNAFPDNVFSIGRLGSYKYLGIDTIIIQAMELNKKLK